MKLQRDLREFVELLISANVDFLIVGAHAVAFHGYPRYTGDLDVWVRPDPENADRVMRCLRDFGFGSVGLDAATFQAPDKIVQLGRPPNRVDILTSVSGVSFEEAWSGRISGELDGLTVAYIGRAELIRNKTASGRAKDLGDVEELQRLLEDG